MESSVKLEIELSITKGRGYVPVEERESEKLEIGYIAIDSIYTPVRNVNFHTENVRVGEMTNFDKLSLDIVTDGTISPEDAFGMAANILVEQFGVLTRGLTDGVVEAEGSAEETTEESAETE